MTYDEAKAEVFDALWLPEIGKRYRYARKAGQKVTIVVYATNSDGNKNKLIAAYRQHFTDERYYFTQYEWWYCTSNRDLTVAVE